MASYATPPVPIEGAGAPKPPEGGDMASMMGDAQPQQAPSSDMQDRQRAFMRNCQGLDQQLQDFARQFPEFSPFAKVAREAIGKGMQKVVAGMGRNSDVQAPQVPY